MKYCFSDTFMSIFSVSSLASVYAQLTSFANLSNFWSLFDTAFGSSYDFATAATLRSQWQSGNFSLFPIIEVVGSDVLGRANGAYAISTNKIYLSEQFLVSANQQSLEALILEEFGHFVDAKVNNTDTAGDEGELFSDLVRGVEISSGKLQRLRAENDTALITIDGQTLQVEESNYNLGVVEGSLSWNDSLSDAEGYYDNWTFQISATGGSTNYVSVSSDSTSIDLVLKLYDQYGNSLGSSDDYSSSYNYESLSLSGLTAGIYTIQVYDFSFGANDLPLVGGTPYSLTIAAPDTPPNLQPDLTPYQPTGWSDKLVISTITGTTTNASQITTADQLYIDWSYLNQGSASLTSTVAIRLLLDGTVIQTWNDNWTSSVPVNPSAYRVVQDVLINPQTAGTHTLELEIDYLNQVTESIETNNSYTKTFTVTAPSISQDAYEVNNSFSTATNLTTPGIVQTISSNGYDIQYLTNLSLHNASDVDIFKFNLSVLGASDSFVFVTFDSTQGLVDLELWDATGTSLLYSAYGTSSVDYALIPLEGFSAGNYNLVTGSVNQSTNPNYSLFFILPTAPTGDRLESNNTFGLAKDLGTIANESFTGGFKSWENLSIHTGTDEDWFRFTITGTTTDQNYIGIDFDDSGDLDISLYNASNQLIDFSSGISNSETISLASLTAGTYYLQVYGYSGSVNDYNLTINAPGTASSIVADRFEANNTQLTATNLNGLDWIQGVGFNSWENLSIGANDKDWFKFDLKADGTSGDYVAIAFDTYQGDLDLELYNASGTLIESAKGFRDIESISLDDLTAGIYYANVVGFSGKTNPNYSLLINTPGSDRFEDNDSKEKATILKRNTNLQSWDSLSIDDQDWFKITLPSGVTNNDFVSISFDHSQGDIDLELYNSTGTTKLQESKGVGNTEEISLAGLSGDYYVKVFGYNNATNPNYSLTVNAPISNTGDWLEANNIQETNNTQAKATDLNTKFSQQLQAGQQFIQLGIDAEKPLSIHTAADVDWFKFTLATAGQLGDYASIAFNHTAGDLDLELRNSAGQLLKSSTGIANSHTVDLKGLAAGIGVNLKGRVPK